jgi:hypothetical protein
VNSLLKNSKEIARLFVDPKCKRVIECLEKQLYKEGTQVPDKDAGYDHMNDAIGYGVEFLYPIRREITTQPQPVWGMGTRTTKTF